ncbi:PAS domain S-box-containing protein [Marinospirillum celere]|uniref:histidine kinase n=1 Tax=Marinospirillum celere TaxID=1122252 RepID=A0A1I1HSU1_9GAMM|nr:PAS domain S-box protein [Marinospirillum celere]SFC27199.1 PAS domain S-box-containing protein [Marinospirillum celere]
MSPHQSSQQLLSILMLLTFMALILFSEPLTQLGFAHGFLYVPLLLLVHRLQQEHWIWPTTLVTLGLVVLGYFLSPPPPEGFAHVYVLANRLLSCLVLLATGYLLKQIHDHGQEQKRQQEELEAAIKEAQETREYFLSLAETLPISIWTASPDGRIDYTSPQMIQTAGISKQELMENWISYLHPDDQEKTAAAWSEALKYGHSYEVEHRFRQPDGNYSWYLLQAQPIKDEQGKIKSWLGSSVDISNQKQLMREKDQLVSRLNAVLESISDGFFTLDKNLHFTYVNSTAAETLGVNASALLHQAFVDQPLVYKNPEVIPRIQQTRATGLSNTFEQQIATGDWYLVSLYPFNDGVSVYFRNITKEHQAQQELNLLRTAVSRLNDVIIITEAEPISYPGPKIVYVNDAFERITGYSREEALGKSPRFLQGPNTDPIEVKRMGDALRLWQPVSGQLLNYKKNGEEFWFDLNIVPLANDKGWYTHWVAVERDITDQKQIQLQLSHAQRMESIGQLTGGIAHDFNNLLTVISGNTELLDEQLADQPRLQALAKTAVLAAERGAQLTRSLLTFARKQTLKPQTIQVNQLILDMQALINSSLGERYQLEVNLKDDLWLAGIDPSQLENTLLNLIINARDASPLGGKITLETRNVYLDSHYAQLNPEVTPGDYVAMLVTDEGSGIHPDILSKIFDPFFTTKDKTRGTGLGLSMAFGFIKQSGGHLTVNSKPGEGSCFSVFIPRATSQEQTVADLPPVTLPENADTQGQETLLVVEDNALVRNFAASQLKAAGYRVTTAENGEQALALFQKGDTFDLLFTDVIMPGQLNGLQLAEAALELQPGLPVIFTSGYTENALVDAAASGIGIDLLNKPYHRQELLERIQDALKKAQYKAKQDD